MNSYFPNHGFVKRGVALLTVVAVLLVWCGSAWGQTAPSLRLGPALAHGYEHAHDARIGIAFTAQPDDGRGREDSYAAEIGFDLRLPGGTWLVSARLPLIAESESGEYNVRGGNLGLELTRATETRYNAEAFVGVLLPVISFGIVAPTSTRTGRPREAQRAFVDGLALYRRDTAAMSIATYLRLDLFLLHGLFVQSGPKLELIDTGDFLIQWNSGFGFRPFKLPRIDLHVVGEHTWVREAGDFDLIDAACNDASDLMCQVGIGTRTLFRVGLLATIPVGKRQISSSLRYTIPNEASDLANYLTLDVFYAF